MRAIGFASLLLSVALAGGVFADRDARAEPPASQAPLVCEEPHLEQLFALVRHPGIGRERFESVESTQQEGEAGGRIAPVEGGQGLAEESLHGLGTGDARPAGVDVVEGIVAYRIAVA